MTPRLLAIAVNLTLAAPLSAKAQMIVHDPTSYASLIREAQTALDQLSELKAQLGEAKRLYDGFNNLSHVNDLAKSLAAPELRAFVPDIDKYVAAAKGDLTALGALGRKAGELRDAQRLFTAKADDLIGQDLERQGDRAARDLALGQQVAAVGASRLAGLEELTQALDTAPNARAAMDLQARLSAELAMIANDQMRLQGLAMAQAAEARLQTQRDQERAATARADRMAAYRRGFQ